MSQQNESGTTRIDKLVEELQLTPPAETSQPADDAIIPWVIELRVVGTPNIVRVPVQEMLVIGRRDDSRGFAPDIDLSPYDAQKCGVSRKHARMIMRDNRLTIEDLGSANGTYVNGHMLDILRPQRIHTGDHVKLGALSMQVHFLVKPSSNDETVIGLGNSMRVPRIAHGERLLIVEDNTDISQVVRFIGQQSGFNVHVATSLTEAYVRIDEQQVDILMVELLMNEGSGLPVVDYVRGKYQRPVPIIAIADSSGGYTTGQALAVGVDLNLVKPIAVDELTQTLTKALILWTDRSSTSKVEE